jgi:hypothetical protein
MKKFKTKITKDNLSTEIIFIAENENQIKEFMKIITNNSIQDTDISFPSFTAKEVEDFKKLIN